MSEDFDAPVRLIRPVPPEEETLRVELAGFEGPLDLLLDLAKREKVDLLRIKILPLAEQYLDYIARAKALRIELAADLLVMAAWLAYLKSRLLAPDDGKDEEAEELAEDLTFRLRRLEAMREAADGLFARARLGRDVFARGMPEVEAVTRETRWTGSLFHLLAAYGAVRQAEIVRDTTMEKRPVFSLVDARKVMERIVGGHADWLPLDLLIQAMPPGHDRKALIASTFGAALEMAKDGRIAVRQGTPFGPLFIRPAEPRREG